jgi:hypothetical protein
VPSFTVGVPAEVDATWTTLSWRKLDSGDPLAAIRRVVPWSGGYLAVGRYDAALGGSPIWTSTDGAHFQPASFIEAAAVLDVDEVNAMLLALVADPDTAECPDVASCVGTLGSVRMLVSVDRISWRQGSLPDLASQGPINGEPLTAIGPGGLLVATSNGPVVAARSADGVAWSLESAAFPQGFELAGLWGRRDGYAAVGTVVSGPSDNPDRTATALWSDDGRTWSITSQHAARPDFVLAASEPEPLSDFVRLVPGRDGAAAISHEGGTPGVFAWWHSDDGRSWRKVADFPPLGSARRGDGSSFGAPDGIVASDGSRMLAVRVRDEPAAWTSFDGSTWTQLALDGAPSQDGDLLMLPSGVLLFDGQSTWLGEASAR